MANFGIFSANFQQEILWKLAVKVFLNLCLNDKDKFIVPNLYKTYLFNPKHLL